MRYIHAIALMLLAAFTVACSSDERDAVSQDVCQPMLLSVGQGGMTVDRTTRGYSTTPTYNGGYTFTGSEKVKIGVTGISGSTRSTTTEQLKVYTAASGTNTVALSISPTTDQFYWMGTSEYISMRAWSYGTSADTPADIPTSGASEGKLSFTISATQTAADVKELLYAKAATYDYATYNAGITLNFYHQLSRMVINVKRDNTSDAISSVIIGDGSTTNIPTSATFSIPTGSDNLGTWTGQGDNVHTITPKSWTGANITTGYEQTLSAVMIPTTYAAATKLISVTTAQGTFAYALPDALTLDPGKQYTFNIEVRNQKILVTTSITDWDDIVSTPSRQLPPDDIKKNPLWYVAEYNMINPKNTVATMGTAANQGYFYSWESAMALFSTGNASGETSYYNGGKYVSGAPAGTTWHLPVAAEWCSILPKQNTDILSILSSDGAEDYTASRTTAKFGYNSTTQTTGIVDNSYLKRVSSTELHALRFLGTDYCSAWKYVIDNDRTLTISATLVGPIESSLASAKAWYDLHFANVTFGNNEAVCAVQRTFAALGCNSSGSNAAANANTNPALAGYWGTTLVDSKVWSLGFGTAVSIYADPHPTYGMTVRLFRDNYTDARPAPVCTVDQILAGISTNYEVGDVVCQDGSIYRYDGTNNITAAALAEKAGRKPIGIIAYKCAATPTYTDLQVTEGMGHALVMGINDIGAYSYASETSADAQSGTHTEENGWMDETYGSPNLFPNVQQVATRLVDFRGLEKTNVLGNKLCDANHIHEAFTEILSWRSTNSVGFTSSPWFIASTGQWMAAFKQIIYTQSEHEYTPNTEWNNVVQDWTDIQTVINTQAGSNLEKSGYWTSSEFGPHDTNYLGVFIDFNSTGDTNVGIRMAGGNKFIARRIRPFLAF